MGKNYQTQLKTFQWFEIRTEIIPLQASREIANLTGRKNPHTPIFDPSSTQKTKSHFRKGSQVWLPELLLSACFHPFGLQKSFFD